MIGFKQYTFRLPEQDCINLSQFFFYMFLIADNHQKPLFYRRKKEALLRSSFPVWDSSSVPSSFQKYSSSSFSLNLANWRKPVCSIAHLIPLNIWCATSVETVMLVQWLYLLWRSMYGVLNTVFLIISIKFAITISRQVFLMSYSAS